MSGLIALLDDVVALTKLAAASVDDVASMAAKAGTKTAGVVIDDAAVTPKYVTGLSPKRELPIIWKIARASFFNNLVILLPVAMLLKAFAPVVLVFLLLLGGLYLCFEGAEKVWHVLAPHKDAHVNKEEVNDPAHLEESRVRGAIKTDFILSAEILTITLNEITKNFPDASIAMQGAVLALIAVVVTAVVYGSVALIVKADDTGLWLARNAPTPVGRTLGRGLVKGMPHFLMLLSFIGTLAMLWVGGSILDHRWPGWNFRIDCRPCCHSGRDKGDPAFDRGKETPLIRRAPCPTGTALAKPTRKIGAAECPPANRRFARLGLALRLGNSRH